jgi:hypothetical protein
MTDGAIGIRGRVRAYSDGLGAYLGVAVALLVFAVLGLLLLLQSPKDVLLWTGTRVVGSEQGGLIYYTWHGESYTLDVPGYGNAPHVVVYVDPSDPTNAERESLFIRVADGALTVLPAALAAGVVALGVYRRRSTRRQDATRADGFGAGLDPDFVRRQLEQLRRNQP